MLTYFAFIVLLQLSQKTDTIKVRVPKNASCSLLRMKTFFPHFEIKVLLSNTDSEFA